MMNGKRKTATIRVSLFTSLLFLSLPSMAQPVKFEGDYNTMWELSADGKTLTISGEGYCPKFNKLANRPWHLFSDKITTVIVEEGVKGTGVSAFESLTNLTTVVLPQSLKSIASNNFKDCKNLRQIKLPSDVRTIYSNAFEGCTSLENLDIPGSIEELGDSVFKGCTNLKSITCLGQNPPEAKSAFEGLDKQQIELAVGSNLYAYYPVWRDFKSVSYTADADTTLTGITGVCGENLTWEYHLNDSTISIYGAGDMTDYTSKYENNPAPWSDFILYGISLSNEVTSIGSNSFPLSPLRTAFIPKSVTKIGSFAFFGSRLKNVTFMEGSNLSSIGTAAFSFCPNLENILLPNLLKHIGSSAFAGCSNLTNVYPPKDLAHLEVGEDAFKNCPKLTGFIGCENWQLCSVGDIKVIFTENAGKRGAYSPDGSVIIAPGDYTYISFHPNIRYKKMRKETWLIVAVDATCATYYDLKGFRVGQVCEESQRTMFCNQADALFKEKKYDKARKLYEKAEDIRISWGTRYSLGSAYYNMGKC